MGTPEVGQTLTADTTGIADADGLTGAVFTFRWLAGDAEIAGATGSTHTLTGDDLGKAIRVRVTFTDDGGNEESLTSEPTVAVAVGLELQSATVDGAILTLTYNAILDNSVTLSSGDFAVNVAGSSRSISGVSVGGHSVTLTLSSAVAAGNTVTVDYTAPSSRFADAIRDTVRRRADSFTGQAVTNNTTSGNQSDRSRYKLRTVSRWPPAIAGRSRRPGTPRFRPRSHRVHRPVEGVGRRLGGPGRCLGSRRHRHIAHHHRPDRRHGVCRAGHRQRGRRR